jgi:hypothetical protein
MAFELQAIGVEESFKAKPPDHVALEVGRTGFVFFVHSSECSAGYEVLRRDLHASDSPTASPQQVGPEEVLHLS